MKTSCIRAPRALPAGRRGHTLMELLVSIGIFVFLGSALIALLNQGVTIWHLAESRGRIYERARAVLDTVAEDLRHAATGVQAEGTGFWIRFICDEDSLGRQRLRFVRAIAGESTDPIARRGGEFLARSDSAHMDHHNDFSKIQAGLLLAPAGFQEVIYAMDIEPQSTVLMRGVRSPIGEEGSLFIDRNIEEESRERTRDKKPPPRPAEPPPEKAPADGGAAGKTGADAKTQAQHPLRRAAQPLAGEVMYLGFRFWRAGTSTWDPAIPPLEAPKPGQPSGATEFWDSTRAILEEDRPASGQFAWRRVEGSLMDPYDDVFPEKIEIVAVIQGNPELRPLWLAADIGPGEESIPLTSTSGLPENGSQLHVYIEGEWIRYEKIEGGRLVIPRNGRGARGTATARHASGAKVETGTAFRRVVDVPGYRLPVSEEGKPHRRERGK